MSAKVWIDRFVAGSSVEELFTTNALWRDYLAFEWDLQTAEGVQAIGRLRQRCGTVKNVRAIEPLTSQETLFEFDTAKGTCQALVELTATDGKCSRLYTQLNSLNAAGSRQSTDPEVIIIGAGQSGLALAAHLKHQGVNALIIEQNARIGDNWRQRYDSLKLHDPVWVNHLPFKPFPDGWPTFTPKDMMGDWLESYAQELDLSVWTNTRVETARFDPKHSRWTLALSTGQAITAPHLVFALGTSGFPRTPKFPGQDDFQGQQLHSSEYRRGDAFEGQKVVVVGANNSAHDIAVDLYKAGAAPTLIQRSSTHVVPHEVYLEQILKPAWGPALQRPLERSDFLSLSQPMRRLESRGQALFGKVEQDWSMFYSALSEKGFALDFAEDGSGIIGKYRRTASGYYIDVGGSTLVADGKIAVRSGQGVERILPNGLRLNDGCELEADAIVYATGFGAMEEWVAWIINTETAEKIGPCWGYGSGYKGDPGPWEGELRNMWKPTAQQGLWFMGGNLAQVRAYSKLLALQLVRKLEDANDQS